VIVRSLSVIAGLLIGRPRRAWTNLAVQGSGSPMNVALWLERAGKSHASLPAAALGGRVVLD
jgi:hypothetical protein